LTLFVSSTCLAKLMPVVMFACWATCIRWIIIP
jgi:hypothetical protein